MEQAEQDKTTLDALIKNTEKEAEDSSGLTRCEDLLVRSPTDYKQLPLQSLNHLKEQLPLCAALPRPPTLGEFNFLLGKKGNDLRELFEDDWKASTLTHAACAEVFTVLAELSTEDNNDERQQLSEEAQQQLTSAATKALPSASNSLARSREHCQCLAVKAANEDAPKPGSNREKLIAEPNAKGICQVLDTKSKLKRLTQTPKLRGRGRCQNRYWRNRGGRGRRNSTYHYNPRGRGRERGRGGHNTSSTSTQ